MLYALVYGATTAIMGIILYPLFDLILCKFITNSNFVYSAHQHITQPVLFGFFMGIVLTFINSKKDKEDK